MIKLKVSSIIKETNESVTLVFDRPIESMPYKSGQFVTLHLKINGELIKRSYSFSSSPNVDYQPSITVKKIIGGKASSYLVENVKVGDILDAEEPLGNFCIETSPSNIRTIVLIGAGSGITPLFSMAKSVLSVEQNSKVYLLYGNRTEQDIIFRDSLAKLQMSYGNRFQCIHVLSKASSSWYGLNGRIDRKVLPNLLEQLPVIFPKNSLYYICGPDGMMSDVISGLNELGVPAININKERYMAITSSQPVSNQNSANLTFPVQVSFNQKGVMHLFTVSENQTILEGAQKAGIRIRSSCESGVCTSCMCTLTEGEVDMGDNDTLTANEIARGYILTCVAYPKASKLSIETNI